MDGKTACVVGAGAAGIAAIKECVRHGFQPTCYELDSDIGGVWHKKDYSKSTNTPAVWDNLITNSSKFMSCYSDFPPSPHDTPYLSAEAMYQYFKRAVKHYDVEKYIQFNTRVIKIRKTSDHERTGRWEVYTTETGSEIAGSNQAGPRTIDEAALSRCHKEVFDYVLVCTGFFKIPIYPEVPGLDKFLGTVHHSFSYEGPKPFDGETVLVVGNKRSAADITSDIANVAKKVYLSVGQGMWVIPRCFADAHTLDMLFSRSLIHSRDAVVQINNRFIKEAESKIDHTGTGIRPDKPPMFAPLGISDDLPVKLLSGRVQAYGRLTRLEEDKAYFGDGKVISGITSVLFCTGYSPDLSFLDLNIFEGSGKMETYQMVFPLDQKHNSLALIGNVGGDSPAALLFEQQARLATLVFAGKHQLPSRQTMKKDIDFWNDSNMARKGNFKSYYVNTLMLTEMIAQEIGCYPTFWKVFIGDPVLAGRTWYGPMYSAHYRLVGPGSQWNEAGQTCHELYKERYSSIRHKQAGELHRPDVQDYFKSTVARVLALVSVPAAGVLIYKYQDLLFK